MRRNEDDPLSAAVAEFAKLDKRKVKLAWRRYQKLVGA
jgi:hypothetical protein